MGCDTFIFLTIIEFTVATTCLRRIKIINSGSEAGSKAIKVSNHPALNLAAMKSECNHRSARSDFTILCKSSYKKLRNVSTSKTKTIEGKYYVSKTEP